MKERNWKSGPPPHIGWWNASMAKNPYTWRWWDGTGWRASNVDPNGPRASLYMEAAGAMEWTDYYPEGARVPRIDPSLPDNKGLVYCINATQTSNVPSFWAHKAWEYAREQHNADWVAWATSSGSRTVREMQTRVRPISTGQAPNTVTPHTVELMDIPAKALLQELLRRQS
jgi:hypothetical protein